MSSAPVPIEPVRVTLDEGVLEDLRGRLAHSRLPAPDTRGWERGVPGHWLAGLLADWRTFDAARFEARLNRMIHLQASLTGQLVHLVHAPGHGPDRCRCC
jgi:Epoxide hydrolase N terminus